MMHFSLGEIVMVRRDPQQVAPIVNRSTDEAGRTVYQVEGKGAFYPKDLWPAPYGEIVLPAPGPKKTVLVTGGAGYIGSILVRGLLQQGFRVVCLDILRYGGQSLVDLWDHRDFIFRKVDITDFTAVDEVIDGLAIDGIVHLAAIVGDPACKMNPELAMRTNRDASLHLLDKAVRAGIPRFVFASTCSNYGKMKDPDTFVDENSPLAPVSLYAELKVGFEKVLLDNVGRPGGFAPTALRFATVYGMSPRMRFDLTVNEFTKEIALGRELVIFGENFWRPYCHVSDFTQAILRVLKAPEEKVAYDVFNVGDTSQNYTKKMIAEELLRRVPEARIRYVQRTEDPRDYRVNFQKIRDVLGFHISRTVPEGICDMLECIWQGMIENPDDQRFYNIPVAQALA